MSGFQWRNIHRHTALLIYSERGICFSWNNLSYWRKQGLSIAAVSRH